MDLVLSELRDTLEARKKSSPETSYVASLYSKGIDKILEKLGEETTETILAAKNFKDSGAELKIKRKKELINEAADLWFHSMVMLSYLDINYDDVVQVLKKRSGVSGLEEKAGRIFD
jgi:phosphoribosyl-ATP pyrophosphohydrolase